jgi:hypothetical protein
MREKKKRKKQGLAMSPRMALNSWFSRLSLPSAEITSMYHHPQLWKTFLYPETQTMKLLGFKIFSYGFTAIEKINMYSRQSEWTLRLCLIWLPWSAHPEAPPSSGSAAFVFALPVFSSLYLPPCKLFSLVLHFSWSIKRVFYRMQ